MTTKIRIDMLLVHRKLAESREQAKRLLLAGSVRVNGESLTKPGHRVSTDADVVVLQPQKYVSRGGFKLEKALRVFDIDVRGRVAIDVGASTGGFTDCLLQHGARFVYALDVGYGQLAWKLRTHPRVKPIEKMNIREVEPELFRHRASRRELPVSNPEKPESVARGTGPRAMIDIAVIDVSFISLRTVLPRVVALGPQDIVALVKPQFEAGRAHVKKGGIVPDKQTHLETLKNLIAFCEKHLAHGARGTGPRPTASWRFQGLSYSPIHRGIGNIEYLLWLQRGVPHRKTAPVEDVVAAAHHNFEG